MDSFTKIFVVAMCLAISVISAEARDLKPVKPDVFQPQTFPGAYGGYLTNPGLGSGSGIPGAVFGLPSVGAPPILGRTVPTFPSVPGFVGGRIGGHP